MPLRTQEFKIVPWVGGLDTSQDEAMIAPNKLREALNVVFGVRGSRQKRDGIDHSWGSGAVSSVSTVRMQDYWYQSGAVKLHRIVAIRSDGTIRSYDDNGDYLDITPVSNAWGVVPRATIVTFGNLVIMGAEGAGNTLKYWDGVSANAADLASHPFYEAGAPLPPDAWILGNHYNRILLAGDRDRPDFIHYSETNNPLRWLGFGDSGGFPIQEGDGDPEGITAIFPTFKGQLFIGKSTKIYRLSEPDISISPVALFTDGVGVVGPNAMDMVDTDDMYWVSNKGVHRISDSDTFGDFRSKYLSADIQQTFNANIERSRLKYVQTRYLSNINSVLFTFSNNGDTVNNRPYLYNIPVDAWYRWGNFTCESCVVASDTDQKRFYFGRSDGKISKTFIDSFSDIDVDGSTLGIDMVIKTGFIFPDGDAYTYKGFKKIGIVYRPDSDHSLQVCVKIDDQNEQCNTFTPPESVPLLDVSFVLGESILGARGVMASYTRPIDGYGRGFSITMSQSGEDESVEIQGFIVEYEQASTKQEVVEGA